MPVASGTITATSTAGCALIYSGSLLVQSLQLTCNTIGTSTTALFSVYDNNVATSVTNAGAGQTWSGKSPGYSGVGPGTTAYGQSKWESARTGDQAGETSPTSGIAVYWQLTAGTGNSDYTTAPVVAASIATPTAVGNASYLYIDYTNATGNVVAAVTAAQLMYSVSLSAGQTATFLPIALFTTAKYGLDLVATSSGATGITGSYVLTYATTP